MKIRLIRTSGLLFLTVILLLSTTQLALGQAQEGGSDDAAGCAGCTTCCGGGALMLVVPLVGGLASMGAMIGGMWKSFEKVGEPGWAAFVPVYNMMIMSKIAGRGENYGLLCLIPCAGLVFAIIITLDFCKKFDVGGGFAVGMILLPAVFWPMLGFGSARYIGGSARARRRRPAEEEEDEGGGSGRARRRRTAEEEDER